MKRFGVCVSAAPISNDYTDVPRSGTDTGQVEEAQELHDSVNRRISHYMTLSTEDSHVA